MASDFDYQKTIDRVGAIAREVWDERDENGRLVDLKPFADKFLADLRKLNDRHNAYVGSAVHQYGPNSDTTTFITNTSNGQRAREMQLALDEYLKAKANYYEAA